MATKVELAKTAVIMVVDQIYNLNVFELKDSQTAAVVIAMITEELKEDINVADFEVFVNNNGLHFNVIVYFKSTSKTSNYYRYQVEFK